MSGYDGIPDPAGDSADPEGARTRAELAELRRQLDATERRLAGEFEYGPRVVAVAVCVVAVLGALFLPHTGHVSGFQILTSDPHAALTSIVITSRVFVWFSLVFGVFVSGAAILTRRWVLGVVAAAGCAIGCVAGLGSVWSRHTPGLHGEPPSGTGVGLLLGWLALIVLTVLWVRVVWARTDFQLAAEAERRDTAREWDELTRTRFTDPRSYRTPGE